MNDPTVLEAARVLAQRLEKEPSSDKDRLVKAFRLIVCRRPSDKEMAILDQYYSEEWKDFSSKKQDASKALDVGEFPQEKTVDPDRCAALMRAIDMLYNLEETITKT
jgi:hypothetical protein